MKALHISCSFCGKEIKEELESCPYCFILLPRFHTYTIIHEEKPGPHPDPIKRLEAEMAAKLRTWLPEPLPQYEPIQPSDHTLPLKLSFLQIPEELGAKVLIVGEEGVGKTSLMQETSYSTHAPRYRGILGVSFGMKMIHFEQFTMNLVLWNLAPYLKNRHNFRYYCNGSQGIIYIFSVIDRASFENLSGWMEPIHTELGRLPATLVGNKTDLTARRRVPFEDAQNLAEQYSIPYYETSARDGPFLDTPIQHLAVAVKEVWDLDHQKGGNSK